MVNIFSEYLLKHHLIRNRVVFPPVVCHGYTHEDGIVTDANVDHYARRSKDGPGIVITEATCVRPDGKAAPRQLGIWSDEHVEGLRRISAIVKANGAVSLIQLHHGGLATHPEANDSPVGPSADPANPRSSAMTPEDIRDIRRCFIEAALRARQAGFDGVELHGAHGYLLNQFANAELNRRTDEYGGDFSGRMKLATEIIAGIREKAGEAFILSYRMGAVTPLLEDGIRVAKYLESIGIDLLHVSHGGTLKNLPRPPKDFQYNWIVFSGTEVKKQVRIPVIVVNEIKTRERADWLLENSLADFVSLARPILADPQWVKHVRNGEEINLCLGCKPKCRWYESSSLCPAGKK
ncbi:MAG TPA: NADH:flavin oxidoreductase [Bacteroidales bacterium]|nr:NADH:flavin oxidoreductase [Bacteroidales bacterium]